ncbi:GNAT family N-acetyltransferase [Aureimonas sp. AU22]|uniref:GNAT family N-acetyltransferase n=1 Tax=Aureimonas sp. AU22 TaxID=1638162 RepID=UPI000785D6EC|nr:GNAT family N-acetyltransferase [Aureimonas sp. AU22]
MKTIAADVRLAESADAGALSIVHATSWTSAYRGLIPHRALAAMVERRGPDWWSRAIANRATILVMEYGGEVVGYATVGRNRTRGLSVDGEVYELYLKPEFQGVGFGRRLFDACRTLLRARGLKGVAVWSLADNENAVRFYEAAGGADVATGSETFEGVTLHKVAYCFM